MIKLLQHHAAIHHRWDWISQRVHPSPCGWGLGNLDFLALRPAVSPINQEESDWVLLFISRLTLFWCLSWFWLYCYTSLCRNRNQEWMWLRYRWPPPPSYTKEKQQGRVKGWKRDRKWIAWNHTGELSVFLSVCVAWPSPCGIPQPPDELFYLLLFDDILLLHLNVSSIFLFLFFFVVNLVGMPHI